MKLTLTMWNETVTIETKHDDQNVGEMLEHFRGLLLASGYFEESWQNAIKDLADEYCDLEGTDKTMDNTMENNDA